MVNLEESMGRNTIAPGRLVVVPLQYFMRINHALGKLRANMIEAAIRDERQLHAINRQRKTSSWQTRAMAFRQLQWLTGLERRVS